MIKSVVVRIGLKIIDCIRFEFVSKAEQAELDQLALQFLRQIISNDGENQ